MTQALAVAFLAIYAAQVVTGPLIKGSRDAARVWIRLGQVSGSVAIALAILTIA